MSYYKSLNAIPYTVYPFFTTDSLKGLKVSKVSMFPVNRIPSVRQAHQSSQNYLTTDYTDSHRFFNLWFDEWVAEHVEVLTNQLKTISPQITQILTDSLTYGSMNGLLSMLKYLPTNYKLISNI